MPSEIRCDTSCLAGITAATVVAVALVGVGITLGNLWAVLRYRNPRKRSHFFKEKDKETGSTENGSGGGNSGDEAAAKNEKDRKSSSSSSYSNEDHVY